MMLSILRTLPMMRTVCIALLLAALTAVAASGSPAHKARAHRSIAPASASHPKAQHPKAQHPPARHAARPRTKPASRRTSSPKHAITAGSSNAQRRLTRRPSRTPDTEQPASSAAAEAVSLRRTHIVPVAPLRGSAESLARQNEKSDAEGLERILDDDDLNDRIAHGMLVPVPVSAALAINGNLPQNRRYCRPWTAAFLADLARAHQAQFHGPLEVSSAVRTVEYQKRLMGTNGNAAQAEGDVVSPHVTGATIDIAKDGLSPREIYWMRSHLLTLQNEDKIDVEEEFQQACFHITVYKSYTADPTERKAQRRTRAKQAPDEADSSAAS